MPIELPTEPFEPTPEQRQRIAEGLAQRAEFRRRLAAGERPSAKLMPPGKADEPLGVEGEP